MSTIERKEYQETKILRTVSPVRGTRGSTQNMAEFDNNLDNLLEDLQSSVSRPTSSLGTSTNSYKESSRAVANYGSGRDNSLTRVTHLKASNPVTEFSSDDVYNYTSPDGTKSVKTYKKESYSYQTSGEAPPERLRMQNNINELDSLLDDLQQVKQANYESRGAINTTGVDPGSHSDTSKLSSSKRVVQRELQYGDAAPPRSNSRSRTLERTEREEGHYGDLKQTRTISPSPTRSNTSTLTKQTKVTNVHSYPLEVHETAAPDINPEILASLDPNLLPQGNTKVTTTIKTYTYEIPGAGYVPSGLSPVETDRYIYSPNQSQTTPSKSFVYNKIDNSTVNTYSEEPNWQTNVYRETTTNKDTRNQYQKPPPPGSDKTLVSETVTTRNYQPGHPYPDPAKQTFVYNETTTTRNHENGYSRYPEEIRYPEPVEPPRKETYIVKESHNTTNRIGHQEPHPNTTVVYKDTHTTNNYLVPSQRSPPTTTIVYNKTETDNYGPRHSPYPAGGPGGPGGPGGSKPDPRDLNITYKYTSKTSSTNNFKGGYPNEESQPLLQPQPFPRDDGDGPPKRVEELMATIGREPPDSPFNAGYTAHEVELVQKKKIDSMKQHAEAETQKKEAAKPAAATKNITGPAVYYPPGHEMFAKKEESGAWRAEGGMARESGKYKYEAESSSKSKSSSGAAIVPVCLPLCCGLPCVIL